MTTTLNVQPTAVGSLRDKQSLLEPLSGIGFVVLFVLSVVVSSPPADNASANRWIADYTGKGHQVGHLATGVLLVLAGLCFLSFVVGLWRKIESWSTARRSNPLPLATAAVAAACIAAGGVCMASASGAELTGKYPLPAADVLRFANDFGFALVSVAGMLAAALTVASVSVYARNSGVLTNRALVLGIVVAVLLLASVAFIPIVALLIWVSVMAIRWLRGSLDENPSARREG